MFINKKEKLNQNKCTYHLIIESISRSIVWVLDNITLTQMS